MADRKTTIWKLKKGIYSVAEFGRVTITTGDTVTYASMDNVLRAHFITMATGGLIASTQTTNLSTITGVCTDEPCVYIAYGQIVEP